MKDMYVLHKTIEEEYNILGWDQSHPRGTQKTPNTINPHFGKKFVQLFSRRRLRNALISASTVNLAQQLCGSKSKLCLKSTPNSQKPPAWYMSMEFILLDPLLECHY